MANYALLFELYLKFPSQTPKAMVFQLAFEHLDKYYAHKLSKQTSKLQRTAWVNTSLDFEQILSWILNKHVI